MKESGDWAVWMIGLIEETGLSELGTADAYVFIYTYLIVRVQSAASFVRLSLDDTSAPCRNQAGHRAHYKS